MGARFRPVRRDERFLLPPDVREWLPAGHPALFVVELVESLDLSGFVAANRSTPDRGRPAYHPEVMVGIVLYASMTATMSSRRIERLLATDAGFRVVASNERPDHVTICRFLARHGEPLEDLFAQVVGLAAEAGLVDPTMVALDGTKMAADASKANNVKLSDLRERFAGWAAEVAANDAADDETDAAGETTGPIPEMFDREQMREWIEQRLAEREGDSGDRQMNIIDPDSGLLPRHGGGFVQGYNAQAAAVEGGIVVAADVCATPADSTVLAPMVERISDAVSAATGQGPSVVVADAGYWETTTIEAINADLDLPDVLVSTGRSTPTAPPAPLPEPDLDAHATAVARYQQAIDAEWQRRVKVIARVVAGQLILREAADLLGMSVPRVGELSLAWRNAGGPDGIRPRSLPGVPRPTAPRSPTRPARARHDMDTRLASPAGRSLYRQRQSIIEPVFGDLKMNRRLGRFLRRGTDKVRTEWHWMLLGPNLTILHARTG
jgi:transposase